MTWVGQTQSGEAGEAGPRWAGRSAGGRFALGWSAAAVDRGGIWPRAAHLGAFFLR